MTKKGHGISLSNDIMDMMKMGPRGQVIREVVLAIRKKCINRQLLFLKFSVRVIAQNDA